MTPEERLLARATGGYRRAQELQPIHDALNANRYQEAFERATTIIETPDNAFPTERHAQVIKANSHLLRAKASFGLGWNKEDALRDEKAAAALGMRDAAFQVAVHLTAIASNTNQSMLQEAENYYRIAAELGDPRSMAILSDVILRQRGEDEERLYWSFQHQLSRPQHQLGEVFERCSLFNDQDIEYFERILAKYSLSGGVLRSNIQGLPGRSYLATFLNDLLLRRQLNFIWSAFYQDEVSAADSSTTLSAYRALRTALPDTPFADLYMLVPGRTRNTDPLIFSRSRDQIAAELSPGDQIVARCGPLTHQATIWSVDWNSGMVLILDPFWEFWQPEHNSCVTRFDQVDYRHKRKLVQVALSELEGMLTTVMTVRDRHS